MKRIFWASGLPAALAASLAVPLLVLLPLKPGVVAVNAADITFAVAWAAALAALLPALLLRPRPLRPLAGFLAYETAAAFLVSCASTAAGYALHAWVYPTLLASSGLGIVGALLSLACSGPAFVCLRLCIWLLRRWDDLQRRHFLWSMTHSLLLVAAILAGGMLLLGLVFVSLQLQSTGEETSLPLRMALSSAPLLAIGAPLIVAGLLFILPPAALFSWWVARRQTRRLDALAHAAAALRRGDLAARTPVEGQDELAQLQADFNRMAESLQQSVVDLQEGRSRVAGLLNAQRELTVSVSHELRTPLAALRGMLDSTLDHWEENLPGEEVHQNLQGMRREVERLQALIDDLFTVSRAEVQRLSLDLQPVDGCALVSQVVRAAAPEAWRSGRVEVSSSLPPALPLLNADPLRLEQVLHNLLHNAVRHTPPGGVVLVTLRQEAEWGRLDVCDSGEGIPAAEQERIWERFYQRPGDQAAGSSGLGLAIVRDLVSLMGGRVGVQSTPGEGACFSAWIPLSRSGGNA